MSNHTDIVKEMETMCSLICERARGLINAAIAENKRIPITKLDEMVSKSIESIYPDADKIFCYHIITKYIKLSDDLHIQMGPSGGVEPKAWAEKRRQEKELQESDKSPKAKGVKKQRKQRENAANDFGAKIPDKKTDSSSDDGFDEYILSLGETTYKGIGE